MNDSFNNFVSPCFQQISMIHYFIGITIETFHDANF